MARRQSIQDRQARLDRACCPIHGIDMVQVGNEFLDGRGKTVVQCPRDDCDIEAITDGPHGPAHLRPLWAHLLREPATVTDIATRRALKTKS